MILETHYHHNVSTLAKLKEILQKPAPPNSKYDQLLYYICISYGYEMLMDIKIRNRSN